jgi:hypothetical protein
MRLMFGQRDFMTNKTSPTLLVEASIEPYQRLPDVFDFLVLNGEWRGIFNNGRINIHNGNDPFHYLEDMEIICVDQKLLSGDYDDVFAKFI